MIQTKEDYLRLMGQELALLHDRNILSQVLDEILVLQVIAEPHMVEFFDNWGLEVTKNLASVDYSLASIKRQYQCRGTA